MFAVALLTTDFVHQIRDSSVSHDISVSEHFAVKGSGVGDDLGNISSNIFCACETTFHYAITRNEFDVWDEEPVGSA